MATLCLFIRFMVTMPSTSYRCALPVPSHCSLLHKRVVCSAQYRASFSQSFNLACSCCLAYVVVLEQPIALGMETSDVFQVHCQLLACGILLVVLILQLLFCGCLCRGLICDRFGILCTLGRGVFHHFFILFLSILLHNCCLLHLFVQISHQQINHCDDSVAAFTLLLVRSERLWW